MPAFKFRAELVQKMDTHFYGKTTYMDVYEHVVSSEFDKREKEDISPSYVSLHIPLKSQVGGYDMYIKADPGSLESDGEDGWFHVMFDILLITYQINVQFDDDGKIVDCYMEQWRHLDDDYPSLYYGRDDIEILDSTDINY